MRPDRRRLSVGPRRDWSRFSEIREDIEVAAEAADGKEACELNHELAPDVLLLDLRMPEKDGKSASPVRTALPAGPF